MAGLLLNRLHNRLAPAAWLRVPKPTARMRLTLLCGALFLVSAAGLLAVTYVVVDRATATVILPDGLKVSFGNVIVTPQVDGAFPSESPAGYTSPQVHGGPTAPVLTHSQVIEMASQIGQVHSIEMHELLIGFGMALGVMALVSVALGWLISGRMLRPVRTISATARQISASNLHERLSLDGPKDEFRELAATLDDLFGRLQASFESQRRFVANASHELRTPLTLDRALLERALRRREPTPDLWRATCERLLISSRRQNRTIDALLTLARSEGGLSSHETFELETVIDGVLLSPELGIETTEAAETTETTRPRVQTVIARAPVSGDPRLVERLVRNLVDNAIRYNEPAGEVDITAGTRSGHTVLTVANTGPTIPAPDVDRLFQPFQRFAPNRSSHADGTGLGLSIVKAIADAHDATITATPRSGGGLSIEVSFPLPDDRTDLRTEQHRPEQHRTGGPPTRSGSRVPRFARADRHRAADDSSSKGPTSAPTAS
jgi:signal transduction histidine kinase